MALSSAGIGSGLNVNSLVSQLMSVERAPVTLLDTKEASYQAKLSSYGTLKSALAALQTAAKAISTPYTFSPMKASVTDPTVLSASVSANAVAGSYNVEVQSLAQSQKLITGTAYANTTNVVGTGVITFNFGAYNTAVPPVFTGNANKIAKTVTLGANTTLAGMRDAINAANMGVSASIINNGTANYLTLTSNDTGASNALQITVSDPSLNALAYNPTSGGTTNMAQIVAAKDAVIVVDNVTITKPSNTITDAIQGVTLNLTKTMPAGTTTKIALTRDTSSVQTAITAFVQAYNDTNTAIKAATAFNTITGKGSILTGDNTTRTIQTQLRAMFSAPVPGAPSGMTMLADIGISFQKDGSLAIDTAKLAAAATDPSKDLSKLFATTDSGKGYGYQMDVLIGKILSPVGTLIDRTNSVNKSIKDIGTQRDTINARLVGVEKRYRAQFTALDTLIASMTTTSNFLTQQLANLPKSA
ncbi:MAG: flagellar filament capping protein FliD [Glaciimonas sp.]|nr:flagellar filament capping protein FliD [Glaciimonas sp.]